MLFEKCICSSNFYRFELESILVCYNVLLLLGSFYFLLLVPSIVLPSC